jgi:hypothetical protein
MAGLSMEIGASYVLTDTFCTFQYQVDHRRDNSKDLAVFMQGTNQERV